MLQQKYSLSSFAAILVLSAICLLCSCAKQFPDIQGTGKLSIDSIAPANGSGGTAVLLYGKGFSANPLKNKVYFNGVPALTDTIASYNVLRVFAPANGSTGPVSIATGGDSVKGPIFSYLPRPNISNVVYNGPFIIYGSNFDPQGSVVSIGGQTTTGFVYAAGGGQQTLTRQTYSPPVGLDNPVPVIVTALGISSNVYPYLFNPVMTGFSVSRTPDGNPVSVYGSLFGSRSLPSTVRVFYYDANRQKVYLSPDPTVVSWATGLIMVNVPAYFTGPLTHIPPPTYMEVSVSVRSAFLQYSN